MAIVVLAAVIAVNRIACSPFGQVLLAIRENPVRARSLGYNVDAYKLVSFTISAALTGFAASLKSVVFGIASLSDVSTSISTDAVLITLVGGIGTIFGPVVGAFSILSIEHYLAPYGPYVMLVQGIVFMAFVLVFRRGVIGLLQEWLGVPL
jgi:branched-chain amino acid transport system permease protein